MTADLTPLIIDCFAGGGGASTGIENALGRSPNYAINHNKHAIALHAANHPDTIHLINDIWAVQPEDVAQGRHVGLLWASPDCKHFSKAKGGAPRDRNIRDLAWTVVDWAERVKPDVICMENVEEFQTWGPIDNEGQPIKELAGTTYELWIKRLKKAGYKVQWKELRGCDYGAPTIRKRWFLVARRDGKPIKWPAPTHGDPNSKEVKAGKLAPWRTAAECIDWTIPCPSIFDTSEEIKAKHDLKANRPLADNTLARVARGVKRYVLEADRPFIVNLTHGGRVEDADEPFKTITGANRGEKAAVVPTFAGVGGRAGQSRPRGGNEPYQTITAKADGALVAPALASVAHGYSGGRREYDMHEPLGTVTSGGQAHAIIAPSLSRFNGGATGSDMSDPVGTITANSWIKKPGGAAPLGIIAPNLMSMKGTARRDSAATDPHPTVLAGGGHSAVVSPVLTYAQQGGRNRDMADPMHTITASRKDQNMMIAPTMVQTGYGERKGQAPRCLDLHQPLGTAVAGGVKHATVATYLAQQNTGVVGRKAADPMATVTSTGAQINPVSAFLTKYYGTGEGVAMDEPHHTITVKDRFNHVQTELAAPPFGPEHVEKAKKVADLLRAHDLWDGGDIVTVAIDGTEFAIVDIGLRMLTPRELFNAQGFPKDYVIEGVWKHDLSGWHFTDFAKHVQVSACGNSVCPDLAEAIVGANCGHLAINREAAPAVAAE